jgi:hypothetical protein
MLISRTRFFLAAFILLITPFLLYKIGWLIRSEKVIGTMSFVGKSYTGQLSHVYSVIWFMNGKDTIWFNGMDEILYEKGERVPVRFIPSDPSSARIDTFSSIWADVLGFGGVPALMLLLVFLHPDIVPRQSKIRLVARKPFIQIV